MSCTVFINIVCCIAMLYLLWGLYTICSLTSYLILCAFVIYHLFRHGQESGADYISENFNMDRLYEERPDFFIKLANTLNRLNCNQFNKQVIHSLHNDRAIPNGCAAASENIERPVSNLTRLTESSVDTNTDDESMALDDNQETVPKTVISVDIAVAAETESSVNTNTDDESKTLEDNQETAPNTMISVAKTLATVTEGSVNTNTDDESKALEDNQETDANTVISAAKALAAATEGSLDTNTDAQFKTLEDNREASHNTVISVEKPLAAETKANDSDLEEDSDVQSHNGHTAAVAAATEPRNTMVAETEILVDTNMDEESTVVEDNSETIPTATKPEKRNRTINVINNNAAECSGKQSILQEDSDNQTLAETNGKGINMADNLSINTTEKDREVSLSRSNSPTSLGKDEDSKLQLTEDIHIYGNSTLEYRGVLQAQPSAQATGNQVSSRTEEATPAISHPRENHQESGPQQVEFHKPQESCVLIRHQGNEGQGSSAYLFSPTDDPGKLQTNREHSPQVTLCGLVLSHTYSLEDKTTDRSAAVNLQDDQTCDDKKPSSTAIDLKDEHDRSSEQEKGCQNQDIQMTEQPLNLQSDQTCDDKKPSSTAIDLKDEHDRSSEQEKGCQNQDKNMAKQDMNLQKDHSSDFDETNYATKSDHNAQHDKHPDQDIGCVDGVPPSSHEASAELQATKHKDQKKQRVMVDVVKEEDAPPDGRPSVKDKVCQALKTEEEPKYDQDGVFEVSMSPSARFHQNGNQPIIIQQNQPEKWPTESSSDSENESKGDHSLNFVP